MALTVQQARPFFLYAREREAIRHRKESGQSRPLTEDAVLSHFRFCNVYREDDATTRWFRQWVRDPEDGNPSVLLATVLFRWFNRMTVGDAIFRQLGDYTPNGHGSIRTAWDQFLLDGRTESMKMSILRSCPNGPFVTGAYIIKAPDGMNKLDGVLQNIAWFNTQKFVGGKGVLEHMSPMGWREMAELLDHREGEVGLEDVWLWLRRFPYLGDFMAYEIVTDLRHTYLLRSAPDIFTWANPGPGAMRGLNRLYGRVLEKKQAKHLFVCEMRQLLQMVNDERSEAHTIWPRRIGHDVEMRDIEHTLCEFDKYERARLGQGRPRGTYS